MEIYETSAIVEDQGQVRLTGVPFEPGTRVEVTITPLAESTASPTMAPDRVVRLLAALDKGRNSETVGPLRRAELYDRDILP